MHGAQLFPSDMPALQPPSSGRHGPWPILLAAGMALAAWYLLGRSLGLAPGIFVDEWYYSKMARLVPLSEAVLPSYLYLLVFGASNACGPGFLDCVRAGNVLFHVAAAPFIYLVACRVMRPGLACAIALLSLLAPLNLYTTYFMPESMYFFGFAVLSWVALSGMDWPWRRHALACGAVLGLMTLVKVHALFLLPATCLFLVYAARERAAGGPWLARGLTGALLAAALALAIKFLFGYLAAGEAGLSLFGSFYGAGATNSSRGALLARLMPAWISGRGHLLALSVLLALPLAALAHALLRRATWRPGTPSGPLAVFTLLAFGSALGLAVVYTASIADQGVGEVLRLHSRYYSFAFPLLLTVALARAGGEDGGASWPRVVIALVLCGLLGAAWLYLPDYDPRLTDSPEYATLASTKTRLAALCLLNAALLALWIRWRRAAMLGCLVLALPLAFYVADTGVRGYLVHLRMPPPPDRAGLAARTLIPAGERADTLVVANGADLFRVQFHLDQKEMILLDLPDDAPIEAYRLPARARWLIAVGRHTLPAGLAPAVAGDGFAIVKLPHTQRTVLGEYAFAATPGPGQLVEAVEGVAGMEGWGRWSDAKRVSLRFARPLPARLTVALTAGAYGPNAGQDFILRAGAAETRFRLAWEAREVVLDLDTDGRQQILEIEVPEPARPSEREQSSDTRPLGISLSRLRIEERSGDNPSK